MNFRHKKQPLYGFIYRDDTQFESSALPKSQPPQPWMCTTYFWCIATCPVPIIQTEKYMKREKSNRDLADSELEGSRELRCLRFSVLNTLMTALYELYFNNLQSIISIKILYYWMTKLLFFVYFITLTFYLRLNDISCATLIGRAV